MRIISGYHKGRILKVPSDKYTRPTTDKTKGVIFNYLSNFMDFDGISVCDIYAGSGALGLEALSRGAAEADFVEKNYPVQKILKENITLLKCEDVCRIFKTESLKFSKMSEHKSYDLILADPPFFKNDVYDVVKYLLANNFLTDDGILIVERSVQTKKDDIPAFGKEPFKKSGDSLLYQFEKE